MSQPNIDPIKEDLRYVRGAIERHEEQPMPLFSRILWASYCLIGYTLIDFYPPTGSMFLLWGGLICVGLEGLKAIVTRDREIQDRGQQDIRSLVHLLGLAFAGAVIYVLGTQGKFSTGYSIGQMYLVLIGYHFFSSGVWSSTKLVWNAGIFLGLTSLIGAVLVSYYPDGVWTTLGIIFAVVIGMGMRIPFGYQRQSSEIHSSI